jgi:hypothetical protein
MRFPRRVSNGSRDSARAEKAAWRHIAAAGGVTTSVTTFGAEFTGDFTTELGSMTLGIVYETLGG